MMKGVRREAPGVRSEETVRGEALGVRGAEVPVGYPSRLTPNPSLAAGAPSPAAGEGRKDDDGKARFDLLPPDALWEEVLVYTVGAGQYGDRNWEKGLKWGRVFAAICRHLFSWWGGERVDPETGLDHLAHAAWGCLALLTYELRGMTEFDNRRQP